MPGQRGNRMSLVGESTSLLGQESPRMYEDLSSNTEMTASAEESLQQCLVATHHSTRPPPVKTRNSVDRGQFILTLLIISTGFAGLLALQYFLAPYSNIDIKAGPPESYTRFPSRDMQGAQGGVASEHETCSEIGQSALIKGGSAVDAAIASGLCVGVVNAFSSGIGGGGFMMVRDANGEVEFIDFREVAPRATDPEAYTKKPMSAQIGGLSVGVPGELRGFEVAHRRHGKLAWKELLLPSIRLARLGFPAGFELAKYLLDEKEAILSSPALSEIYAKNGTVAKEGDWIVRSKLADTLELVADQGAKAFYEGEIAASTIKILLKQGGVMTLGDLSDYQPVIRTPLISSFKGNRVIASPLPTSGAVLIAILNIIEGFPGTSSDDVGIAQSYHRLTEAIKYGFALRTELADPLFSNLTARVEEMISKPYADELRKSISEDRTFDYKHYNPKFDTKELPGTTHVSAVAADSSAAALTTTVNLIFGSKIMDPATGVLFNNQMDDFSIPHTRNGFDLYPSPANFVAPLKRPLSSTVPTIIEMANGKGLLVVGGSGGSRIIPAVLQLILNEVEKGLGLESSLDMPRLHHQLLPNTIYLEPDFNPKIARLLKSKGHEITWWPGSKSAVQAVTRNPSGAISAVSDGRKHGRAAAY